MKLSFKYRIYPNKAQQEALETAFYLCRFLYNAALEERITYYKRYGKTLTYSQQCAELPEITATFPEFKNVLAQTKQQTLKQLDVAYVNFFRRVRNGEERVGFPRFKGKDKSVSICFPQLKPDFGEGSKGIKLLPNKKLQVFGIPEELKVWWHRPWKGRCKQARIKREADRYFLILSCEDVPVEPLPKTGRQVGIDLGLTNFITTDTGTNLHHPRPLKKQQQKLIAAQQNLERKQKGSNNRIRAKRRLARVHHRVANIRFDWLHKIALQLVRDYDLIVLEKLNIIGMLEAKGYEVSKQNIADASWYLFTSLVLYKAERAGKEAVLVDPKNTSRTCSCCGQIKTDLTLRDRTYHCDHCGLILDRDINAALNIKAKGIGMILAREAQKASLSEANA